MGLWAGWCRPQNNPPGVWCTVLLHPERKVKEEIVFTVNDLLNEHIQSYFWLEVVVLPVELHRGKAPDSPSQG